MLKSLLCFKVLLVLALCVFGEDVEPKLKIFILAGQSNMVGQGSTRTLLRQYNMPDKKQLWQKYINSDNSFAKRDDVLIHFTDPYEQSSRNGKLSIGYGRLSGEDYFGPELGFGWTVGDYFDEPVLIIKFAVGGASLYRDYRPKKRKLNKHDIEEEFNKQDEYKRFKDYKKTYGRYFRQMIRTIKQTTKSYMKNDEYSFREYEYAGFVWFQGWNDQFNEKAMSEYKDNMIEFVKSVRKELNSNAMPFIIGANGHYGDHPPDMVATIARAQLGAAENLEFVGNVVTVKTAEYWDYEAEEAFDLYEANNKDKWYDYGNDGHYHYMGSPRFFSDVGTAFGEAMIKLITAPDLCNNGICDVGENCFNCRRDCKKTSKSCCGNGIIEENEIDGKAFCVDNF